LILRVQCLHKPSLKLDMTLPVQGKLSTNAPQLVPDAAALGAVSHLTRCCSK